jgi:hypothetical protein
LLLGDFQTKRKNVKTFICLCWWTIVKLMIIFTF